MTPEAGNRPKEPRPDRWRRPLMPTSRKINDPRRRESKMSRLQSFIPWFAGFLLATCAFPAAYAHEIRPAYLGLKETGPGHYDVLWRTPVLSGMLLPIVLQMPDGVRNLRDPQIDD